MESADPALLTQILKATGNVSDGESLASAVVEVLPNGLLFRDAAWAFWREEMEYGKEQILAFPSVDSRIEADVTLKRNPVRLFVTYPHPLRGPVTASQLRCVPNKKDVLDASAYAAYEMVAQIGARSTTSGSSP